LYICKRVCFRSFNKSEELVMFDPTDSRNDPAKQDAAWKKLNVELGGKLDARVKALRLCPEKLTRMEARIVALAENDYDRWHAAKILGIQLHTLENHRTNVRHKKSDKDTPSNCFFYSPPPVKK
jgi:hypothetical protein